MDIDRIADLPEELRRRIYQRYLQSRARYLWSALSKFVRRMNVVRYMNDLAYDPMGNPHDSESHTGFKLMYLNYPSRWATRRGEVRTGLNIRSRRGVKRPLEDFL